VLYECGVYERMCSTSVGCYSLNVLYECGCMLNVLYECGDVDECRCMFTALLHVCSYRVSSHWVVYPDPGSHVVSIDELDCHKTAFSFFIHFF
jgi:hypothetical protein